MRSKISAYTVPDVPCWVRTSERISAPLVHKIKEDTVYPVAQVLTDISRGACRVKIKSPATGQLVGLLIHEFSYCGEDGQFFS